MAKMERVGDIKYSADDIEFWIKELYKAALRNHDFTKWEADFISSVKRTIDQGQGLSEAQESCLAKLYKATFKSISG